MFEQATWADGDDQELEMIHAEDIENLNLAPLLPKVTRCLNQSMLAD